MPNDSSNDNDNDNDNVRHCASGWKVPNREQVFGVKMNSGISAKITNPEKFANWSWWLPLTPHLISTVFARPGFHISVWIYVFFGNLFYYLFVLNTKSETQETYDFSTIEHVNKFVQRLVTWLLAAYLSLIVTIYYREVRQKAGVMIQSICNVVDIVSMSVDYECDHAQVFLEEIHGAINSMAHYALAHASQNTKFRISKGEMQKIFDSRGYNGAYLLSFQKKETITVLHNAIMQTVQEESEKESSDTCLKSFDNCRREGFRRDLAGLTGAAMSVVSCVSSNKLPFAYHHLIQWGTRVFLVIFTVLSFSAVAGEHATRSARVPFTCFDSVIMIKTPHETDCPTEEYIWINLTMIISTYFMLGCLEMYPALTKVWEHSLVLKNYLIVIDMVCLPLLPNSNKSDNSRQGRQKKLSQLRLNKTQSDEKQIISYRSKQ